MHFEMVPKKPLKLLMAIFDSVNVTKTTIKLPFHLLISGRTVILINFTHNHFSAYEQKFGLSSNREGLFFKKHWCKYRSVLMFTDFTK